MLQFVHYVDKLWVTKWLIVLGASRSQELFVLLLKIHYF